MCPAIRIACLALLLALAGPGRAEGPSLPPSLRAARLPSVTEITAAGLDLRQPLSLQLEWTTPDAPPQVEAVSALLARHGFTVELSRLRSAGGRPLSHTLSARRVERIRADGLEALARALQPLLGADGPPGELRWTVTRPADAG